MSFMEYSKDKRNIRVIFMIALYNLVFLGTEYFFDNVCAVFVEENQVVLSQNIVLGVSAVGFVLYGFLTQWLGSRLSKIMELVLVSLYIVGLVILNEAKEYTVVFVCGCCMFLF